MWMAAISAATAAPLAWSWPLDEERRYAVQAAFTSPYVMFLLEEQDEQVRVWRAAVLAVLRCKPDAELPNGKGWTVRCPIEDAAFFASPVREDEGRASVVVAEGDALLNKGIVTFKLTRDGHVSNVQLEGLDESIPRQRAIIDGLEHFVERAMSSLDTQLPEDDAASWRDRSPLAAELPTASAPVGSILATYRWGDADEAPSYSGTIEGSLAYSADLWKVHGTVDVRFDGVRGGLLEQHVRFDTEPGNTATAPNQIPLELWARANWLGPDDTIALPTSAPW